MKRLFVTCALALGLAACGGSGANATLVKSCTDNSGMGHGICSCIADTLEAELDGPTFRAVADSWSDGQDRVSEALSSLSEEKRFDTLLVIGGTAAECTLANR